jgi:recombinational DNA repair protein (RecF pathway)
MGGNMAKCSVCGVKAKEPIKTWTVIVGKNRRTKITFGAFICEKCRRKFIASISKEKIEAEFKPYPPPHLTMIV